MCAWECGGQKPRKNTLVSNKEILEKKGFLDEREAKLLFYQFLRNNVTFATSLLMGVELFPFQHIMINSMLKSDYSLCVLSRGMSKCAKFDSLVYTDQGVKRIIDVNVGEKILAKNDYCLVESKTVNEKQKTYKITSQKGYESEGLDHHKLHVLNEDLTTGWKFAKDLKVGDCLIMRKNANFFDQINIFDGFEFIPHKKKKPKRIINPSGASISNWYYYFGILIGDGCITPNYIGISSQDEEILSFLRMFYESINLKFNVENRGNGVFDYKAANVSLLSFLAHCGFQVGVKAQNKYIPEKILQASKENISLLLRGLFDTDGHAGNTINAKNSHTVQVGFTSTSYSLIKTMRSLLLMFGIVSKTGVAIEAGSRVVMGKTCMCQKAWSLTVSSYKNVSQYRKHIGFLIKRKSDRLDLLNAAVYVNGEHSERIPFVGEYLTKKYNQGSISVRKKPRRQLFFGSHVSKTLATELTKYIDLDSANRINDLLSDDLFFDKVKSVEMDESVTVDIQVQKEHCYVSDGFINHNSYSAGICAGLDAIFNNGIEIGILSSSFRQCLEENEYVLCESGLKKIKEVSVGEKLFAKDGLQEVKNKWVNQKSVGIDIKTRKGFSLKGKEEHRVLVFDSNTSTTFYKELKDVKIGDYLPVSCESRGEGENIVNNIKLAKRDHWCVKKFNQPTDNEDFYYLLGQFLGDGCARRTDKHTTLRLTTADQETIDFFNDYIPKILPDNIISVTKKEGTLAKDIGVNSVLLGDLFEAVGYKMNQIAINKTIPSGIFKAPKKYVASFIRGIMDSDGHFHIQEKTTYKSAEICLNTSSKELAKQFQLLLLTFGIVSAISTEAARGKTEIMGVKCFCRESYKIRITHLHNLRLFNEKIGFRLSRKKDKLNDYLKEFEDRPRKGGQVVHGRFPTPIKRSIELFYKQNPQYSHFFFDEVIQINKLDEIVTYDIEVENEHCYWGNGFINHNSKMIFKKLEDLSSKPEAYLLKQAITSIRHQSDSWEMQLGKSRITALPLGDGEKLRGYRFNRIYIDEFLLMPERVVTEVLSPFLAVVKDPTLRKKTYDLETKLIEQGHMKEEDRHQFESNKLICLSSASYKFEYLYKLYQQYESLILYPKSDNNAKRCIIQLSYDCAPPQLYDQNQIDQAKATMSDAQFQREYGAQFSDDSAGFFKVSKMALCTIPEGEMPCVEVQGDTSCEYILSLDPSWAESESSDDFSMSVFKLDKEKKISTLVHPYAIPGTTLKEHIKYFHYLLTNFNIVAICGDYNGSVSFISACNQSELFKGAGIELKCVETEFEKPEEYNQNLITAKSEYNKSNNRIVFMRKPTSQWIRNANELLQANFDHRRIYFASRATDESFKVQSHKRIDILNLTYKQKTLEEQSCDDVNWSEEGAKRTSSMIDFMDHLYEMVQLTKVQCAMIVPTTSVQGTQSFDLPKNLRGSGKNKVRKDSYSSLVLGNWMVKIYFDMQSINVEETDSTFTPMMI